MYLRWFQFVADLADQPGGDNWIVSEPPGRGGITPGHRIEKRDRRVTRIGPEDPTAS
jgi:hypothetical protein